MKAMDFLPRYAASSIIIKETLEIFGGYYNPENHKNEVLTYNFGKPSFVLLLKFHFIFKRGIHLAASSAKGIISQSKEEQSPFTKIH